MYWKVTKHEVDNFNRDLQIDARGIGDPPVRGDAYAVLRNDTDTGPTTTVIEFQTGPAREVGVNGITNEALIAIVIDRLECFQRGAHRCRQNALALTKLEEALHWLQDRSEEREKRGVEGTSKR